MAGQMDAGGRGGVLRRGLVAEAKAAILPDVRRLIDESIGRIAVRANGNLAAIGIRSALMFDPAATAVVDDPDHEQVIVPLGAGLPRCSVILGGSIPASSTTTLTFDSVVFDSGGWASVGASTITVADEGDYLIFAGITWFAGSTDPSTGTRRDLMVYCTPTPTGFTPTHLSEIEPPRLASSGSIRHETVAPLHLAAGTVIQVRVNHDASGALLIGTSGNDRGMLTVVKLG